MWLEQLEWVARILAAGLCGLAVGAEREHLHKEAGLRTHMLVAMGAALLMVVSKYGFFDLAAFGHSDIRVDASRVAAQIVSGIGFLGAGMILIRGKSITGLTTAAGLWMVAGIGMALGAGMYAVGAASTLMVLLVQIVLRTHNGWVRGGRTAQLTVRGIGTPTTQRIIDELQRRGLQTEELRTRAHEDGAISLHAQLTLTKKQSAPELTAALLQLEGVTSVEL